MSNGGKESFDPRFDKAFQPGFTGAAVAAPTPRKVSAPELSAPAGAALNAARAESEKSAAITVDDGSEPESRGRTVNPFLIALTALSVVLIIGGLGALQWIRAQFAQDDIRVDIDFFTLDSLKIASPLAIALGIAIGAGVIFVYAINWQKRHA